MTRQDEFDAPENRLLRLMRNRMTGGEPLAKRRPGTAYGIAAGSVVLLLAVIWASYPHGRGGAAEALPVIHAEAGPVKTAPEAEGGMEIPNRESTVFNAVRGRNADGHIENLLPGSEQPIDRTAVFGAKDAKTESADAVPAPASAKVMQLADASMDGAPHSAVTTQLGSAPGFTPQATPSSASASPAETADRLADHPSAKVAPGVQPQAKTPAPNSSVAPADNAPSALPSPQSVPRSGGTPPKPSHPPVADEEQSSATGAPANLAPESGEAKPVTAKLETMPDKGGKYIQIAALADKGDAPVTWKRLQAKFPAQLKDASYRVVPAQVKGHTFYRVQAGPMSAASAASACRTINAGKAGACLAVNG